MKPIVSILVPCFNIERYLEQCLNSLVHQTLKDIEIICINDGSTDNTLSILKRYQAKDSRVRIINKSNTGYGHSMNQGLAAAQGEFIGIVESDDFAELNMYEELYGLAAKLNVDVIKSDFWFYKTSGCKNKFANSLKSHEFYKPLTISDDPYVIRVMPSIWSGLYKREFLERNQIRFLETPGASYQDTSFAFKVWTLSSSFCLTPKAYLHYRVDNPNSSVKSKGKVYAVCDEYEEIDRTMKIHNLFRIDKLLDAKLIMQFHGYRWNLMRLDKVFQVEFVRRFSEEFNVYYRRNLLGTEFYSKIDRNEVMLLLKNPDEFLNNILEKNRKKEARLFIVRLGTNKRLRLFGVDFI